MHINTDVALISSLLPARAQKIYTLRVKNKTSYVPTFIKFMEHIHMQRTTRKSAVSETAGSGERESRGSANIFCEGPESKYFRLCRPNCLSHN